MLGSRLVLALVVTIVTACGGGDGGGGTPAPAPTPLDAASTGTITGVVRLEGPPPTMGTLPLAAWPQCASVYQGPAYTGDVLVKDGLVQNAFVWLKEGVGARVFAVPDQPVVIDQKGCAYAPRVAGARVGQPIEFLNSDPTMHNVHGTPGAGSGWNFMLATKGQERTIRVLKPEVMIEVRCDLHPWMRGYLGVVDHPYFAVTGADGRFVLKDVPAGDYVLGVWHERFGTREARVALTARGTEEVAVTLSPGS